MYDSNLGRKFNILHKLLVVNKMRTIEMPLLRGVSPLKINLVAIEY
jgi:hypothetical protein